MKNGQCVRLRQGKFKDHRLFDSPEKVAAYWESQGPHSCIWWIWMARWRVIRSMKTPSDGSSQPSPSRSRSAAESGRREAIERMLNLGVSRVIIGTKRSKILFLRDAVPISAQTGLLPVWMRKNGLVAIEGWEKVSEITAADLCGQMKEYGVRHVVYTDISRDGMLTGPNVEATRALTEETGMDIIASGGMSSMDDLKRLHDAGVKGAIIGKSFV